MLYVEHMHPDELMSTAQVAEAKGVNIATVNRWAKRGDLPVAVKAPGRKGANLYRRADVEAFRVEALIAGAATEQASA